MSIEQEAAAPPRTSLGVGTVRVINEVIVADEHLPELLESLWWLGPEAIRIEAHRHLVVLDVACDDVDLAPGYCLRRLRKAALDLGIPLATGEPEVVLPSPVG